MDLLEIKRLHFIGIGGVSMSALALIMAQNGCIVSGSDLVESETTKKLRRCGIQVFIGHSAANVGNAEAVVYTSAIKPDNDEYVQAVKSGAQLVERAQLLGFIMSTYAQSYAVCGCHGKTTTVGMLSSVLLKYTQPTIHIGGHLREIGGNVVTGSSDFFVTEACEYYRNFLTLRPKYNIILNIDLDHLDYFKDFDDIFSAYNDFAKNTQNDGTLIVCGDDANCVRLSGGKKPLTFGLGNCDYQAKNVVSNKGYYSFDIYEFGKYACSVQLGVPSEKNVLNALAAFCGARAAGIPTQICKDGIQSFGGVRRRFEKCGKTKCGADIVLDYAHHPNEISALIGCVKQMNYARILCVFQPHTYTRTTALLKDFAKCFDGVDKLILTPIYSAREKPNGTTSDDLAYAVQARGIQCVSLNGVDDASVFIEETACSGDIVLVVGAGNIEALVGILKHATN